MFPTQSIQRLSILRPFGLAILMMLLAVASWCTAQEKSMQQSEASASVKTATPKSTPNQKAKGKSTPPKSRSRQCKTATTKVASPTNKLSKSSNTDSQPRQASKLRLPSHYGKLQLTNQQRERLYSIQGDYAQQFERLKQQMSDIRAKRDRDCQAVLTSGQKRDFKNYIGEARRKRVAFHAGSASGSSSGK